MVAYSVETKKRNVEKHEKIQQKCESSFDVSSATCVKFLVIATIVLVISYVLQINKLATMGYEIKEKENIISILNKDNEALKLHAAELKSMHQLELEKDEMNLTKPEEIDYLEIDDSVAMGR